MAEVGGGDQDSLILGTIIGCPWGSGFLGTPCGGILVSVKGLWIRTGRN